MNATSFLAGVCMTTFAASGVFFLKFWKVSHDSFFLLFGVACWLIALERIAALFVQGALDPLSTHMSEASSWMYVIRLCAFVFILIAVVQKNRVREKR